MSHSHPQRLLILSAIGVLVAAWWYAATLEWRGEHLARDIAAHRSPPAAFDRVPLSPAPARNAAQRLLVADSPDYARIDDLLAYSLDLRPIYAPYWLDRAEAAYQAGDIPAAGDHLATATRLWPTRPTLLWKAAMLHARIGDTDASLATMRRFLRAEPRGYRQVVAVAGRLETDPARMLQAIVPAEAPGPVSRDEMVWYIVRDARAAGNAALARAAWRELSAATQGDPDAAREYVEWMVAMNDPGEAIAAWQRYRGLDPLPGLENGGFEDELRGGLGWRVNDRGTALIERDRETAFDGRASLKITFPGNDNLNFHHVRQHLPVEPGERYTLSFHWRGDAVSTRSGPYLEVRAPSAGRLAASEGQWGTWDWQPRTITFAAPEATRTVEVWVRRNKTSALDNEIAGTVWLDNVKLAAAGGREAAD